jgi:prepilin-type N-terminal cleavage/methylation domain-containing protein/prepilin-type processing-associated H-X9-DG protein
MSRISRVLVHKQERNACGFTLVELLVVISIIALLLAILMPSLQKAREQAKTVVCLSNVKQLGLSWVVYTEDNGGKIVGGWTGIANPLTGDTANVQSGQGQMGWVDWHGTGAGNTSYAAGQEKDQIDDIKNGALYPYTKTIKIYRCPSMTKDQMRSYTIINSMNGWNGVVSYLEPRWPGITDQLMIKRMIQLRKPSDMAVFIDEGIVSVSGWAIYYDKPQWWDYPPLRHGNGTVLGYADGHSSSVIYRDKRTIEFAKLLVTGEWRFKYLSPLQYQNADLEYMQKAAWGKKGYSY